MYKHVGVSLSQVQEVNAQLQREREAEVQARQAARSAEQASGGGGGGGKGWNEDDLQLLIKAVNLFPAGTNARYTLAQSSSFSPVSALD